MRNEIKISETLSDEDYLLSRFKNSKSGTEGKSWMITAKLLFPNNDNILLEAYYGEKESGNVEGAAKYLQNIFVAFPSNVRLAHELTELLEALISESRSSFLYRLFEALPLPVQESLLTSASSNSKFDSATRLRLSHLLFNLFPQSKKTNGPYLLSLYINTPSEHSTLVTDLCFKLLSVPELKIEDSLYEALLNITIIYLKSYIDGVIESTPPWKEIYAYIDEIARRCNWSLSLNSDLRSLNTFGSSLNSIQLSQELYYMSTLIFLKDFISYQNEIGGCRREKDRNEEKEEKYICVEAFVTHQELFENTSNIEKENSFKNINNNNNDKKKNKEKTHRSYSDESRNSPIITHPKSQCASLFMKALKTYQYIKNESGMEGVYFSHFSSHSWFLFFSIDALLLECKYREALVNLRQMPTPSSSSANCRFHLQMASVHYGLQDYNSSADQIFQAIESLPLKDSSVFFSNSNFDPSSLFALTHKNKHFIFLPFNLSAILSYALSLLVQLLKDKGFSRLSLESDIVLGHVIVCLQYNWPLHKDLFYQIIHRIRLKENFTYLLFKNYIIQIEFLEEFVWLAGEAGVALDIFEGISPVRRVGTRGGSRGEKEELRNALLRQVLRSNDDIEALILDFLKTQKTSIFQCLL